jgi:hypothetical protein
MGALERHGTGKFASAARATEAGARLVAAALARVAARVCHTACRRLGRGRVKLAIDEGCEGLILADGDSGRVLPPCRGSK